MSKLTLCILCCCVLLQFGCSSIKPYYSRSSKNWESKKPVAKTKYTVYLIGDAGSPDTIRQEPVLKLLQTELEKADSASAVIFLGDNIYENGMPSDEYEDARADAERKINESLKILKNFKGRPFFLPGNHDWNNGRTGGLKAVREQEKYIEAYLGKDNVFYPENGCAGPQEIKLRDDLVLLILDSEWWLHDRHKEPGINDGCESHSEEEFLLEMDDILKKSQKKKRDVIIASHHPVYSNGNHGGFFSWKDHLFPLTNFAKWLYLPMPVIGSLYPVVRKTVGSVQDLPHPKYKAYRESLLEIAADYDNVVFTAGHEHNLQYFKKNNKHFIVSGSGSKLNYARKGGGAEFTYSSKGFSKLIYYDDGSAWLEVWVPEGDGSSGRLMFRSQIKEPTPTVTELETEKHPEFTIKDSMVTTRASVIYRAGRFKRFWLGEHYRDVWSANIRVPVLDLNKEKGGLQPTKRGGGMQTKSLRLVAPDGKQYTLRSIEKDATPVIPPFMKKTFVENVIQDGISASHPYGAFVIPQLAKAAGVYHTNPRLVYLPYQKNLADYNESFGGEMYLFEERLEGDWSDNPYLGNSKKIISTSEVLEELNQDHDHLVDQKAVVRARLFDLLINDWDRHDDQWRWAAFKDGKKTIYRPIPRDRDQVFFKFDGALPWLASRKWLLRYTKFQTFDEGMYNVAGLTFNARYFDRTFLVDLELDDWLTAANELRSNITDEVIEKSIRSWPDTVFQMNGKEIIRKLKGRRDILPDIAEQYYRLLAKTVDVAGTSDREYFKVERLDNEKTKVTVYGLSKKGNLKDVIYERIFNRNETKEIRLYGRKGNDKYEVTGRAGKGIKVRIIGGGGEDSIMDYSKVSGMRKLTKVYDKRKGGTVIKSSETKNKTSNAPDVNDYDRLAFQYDRIMPVIYVGYNSDDGVFLGAGVKYVKYGFRKYPYASRHSVAGNAALATRGFNFKYHSDFVHVFGKWDFSLDFLIFGPNFTGNYFGLGNETITSDTVDKEFNYMRQRQAEVFPALKKVLHEIHSLSIGPLYQFTQVEKTEGRFVSTPESGLVAGDFEKKHFGGAAITYLLEKLDNEVIPQNGYRFSLESGWLFNLRQAERNFVRLHSQFSVFYTIDFRLPLTLALRVGGASNFGDFEFFQANTLGGSTNLRGYRNYRFSGKACFFNNAELRVKLADFYTIIFPASFGLLGFFDHGRVWVEGESSRKWHYGYGAGMWLSPFRMLVISASYAMSEEDKLFNLNFRFLF